MEHISFSERSTKKQSAECTVHEYPSPSEVIDAAIIDLDGRYPEEGWALNQKCRALLYVTAKHGHVIPHPDTGRDPIEVRAGSQVHIEENERYALQGRMQLLFVSTPKWSPEQAEHIE